MLELRRKVLLPVFRLSELTTEDDPDANKRIIKQGKGHPALTYSYRYIRNDNAELGFIYNYNLFPIVLDRNGMPWALGTLYILAQLEGKSVPIISTFHSKADDLGAYREWLDAQQNPESLIYTFPKNKQRRPTYRYCGHLRLRIQAGEIRPTTAQRHMRTVVAFYRWLVEKKYFQPEYPLWEESQYQLTFKSAAGREIFKRITSTDLSIHAPKSNDPFDGAIQDGGALRPLSGKEQSWILEATEVTGNAECYLIQLFMLATGARIQTAGTLRRRHFLSADPPYSKGLSGGGEVFKIKAGPGTGIDTKNDKAGVLQVPRPIYELLHTYAVSERSHLRRQRFEAKHGMRDDPYLFLTQQGNPYYEAKAETLLFNSDLHRRHEKSGQAIRQFVKERVVPYVREHYDKSFHYRIHDLRASFGMNMTELQMEEVHKGTITYHRARLNVKDLMWHASLDTTDRYLNYRSQMGEIYAAVNAYGDQLQEWITRGMSHMGMSDE